MAIKSIFEQHLSKDTASNQHFVIHEFGLLMLGLLLLLYFFPIGGYIDLMLIQPWVNTIGEFPLRHDWALVELNHRYVKYLLIFIYITWLMQAIQLKIKASLEYRQYAYAFVMVIVSTLLIGLFKSQSDHACPWDMTIPSEGRFIWNFAIKNGHCFPGGHAATGFSLIVGYFIYRNTQPKRAIFYLVSSLIIGMGFGWTQMMRGAHFFSHNLWTAWIIYLLNFLAYYLIYLRFIQPKYSSKQLQP